MLPGFQQTEAQKAAALEQIYVRMAAFKARGTTDDQIAVIFGVTKEEFNLIQETTIFVSALQQYSARYAEQSLDVDDKWDSVEQKGLKMVDDYLGSTFDPDFALRVAQVSNKAQRKFTDGKGKQRPDAIDVDGSRVVIKISNYYGSKLQVQDRVEPAQVIDAQVIDDAPPQRKVRNQADLSFIEERSKAMQGQQMDLGEQARLIDQIEASDLSYEDFVAG